MLQEEGLLDRGLVLIGHSFGGIVSWRLSHKIDTPAVVVGIASPYRGTPLVDFSYAPVSVIKEWFSDYASYLLAFRSKMFATGSSVISPAHRELFWQIAPLSESPPDILISPWLEVTSDVPLLVETLRDNGGEALVSARLITVMGEVAFGDDLSYNDGVVPMKSSGDGAFISRPVIMHVSGDHETPLISEGVVQRLWQIIAKNYPEVRLDV
jgi:triacylglycerol esterase/lipase EstA (alpha/beta hydrolase family)